MLIPVYSTRSSVTGTSKQSEPTATFVNPEESDWRRLDRDHPSAPDTSQTLEFARISKVNDHQPSPKASHYQYRAFEHSFDNVYCTGQVHGQKGDEQRYYDVVAASYPDAR